MIIVDTHCHASPYWFELVEVLLDGMNRIGIDKAVLIQLITVYDNSYVMECSRRFPDRFSVVVVVDASKPEAPETLDKLVKEGAEGVRLNPTERSPGSDPLAIWQKAAELGIPVSCYGSVDQFASSEFDGVVREFPNLSIVIEHLGGAGGDTTPPHATYRKVLGLARYSNTYMKVPGFGEFCPLLFPIRYPFPFEDVPPLIEMAIDAFGPTRLMWGSDFPPVASREGYRNCLRFPMERVPFRSESDKEWVFGKTALSLWKLGQG